MTRKITKGIELIDEVVGTGPVSQKGSTVTYNARIFLRRGDEVTMDGKIIANAGQHVKTRTINGVELIDHVTVLGKRRPIAGIEKSLQGMQKNGYREVMIAPHLAYGDKGIPDLIPANALLRIQIWVQDVHTDSGSPEINP